MRIAICNPATPFMRGGGEMHIEGLTAGLRAAGHEVDVVSIPWKWYPPREIVHQMALWRSLDLSEINGVPIDLVIALKFPAYLVRHERKVVWLIHQHRSAYELWDHPEFGDLTKHEDGTVVRDLIRHADQRSLGEAKRIFTNSVNVGERLRRFLGMTSEALYHRSPLCEKLLDTEPGAYGDTILFPSRIEPLKRQQLAIRAMRHTRTPVRLVLVGTGPGEAALRTEVARLQLESRVELAGHVSDERLIDLYRSALGVFYGPYDEDYGYVPLEAMAVRRPVVVTADSGGPLELVMGRENGLVVDPSPRAVAQALDGLYRDRALAERLGAAGRTTLEERVPPWSQVIERLLT
jgi:glycosyltransferase involved in cell wall biosynthesis